MAKKIKSCVGAFNCLFSAVALTLSSGAFSTEVAVPSQLMNNPDISSVSVSPGGDYVAYVAPVANTDVLVVAKSEDLTPLFTAQLGEDKYVGQISWANDERFLLWPVKAYGQSKERRLTGEVQAMNYDGSDNILLWGHQNGERQGVLTLENRLKYDPFTILVAASDNDAAETRTLHQMDIYSGRILPVERSIVPQADFSVTAKGEPLVQVGVDKNKETVIAYKDAQNKWQLLADGNQYANAWAFDHKQIALKVKDEPNKLVLFNRFTGEYSSMADNDIAALEKEQRDQQGMASNYALSPPRDAWSARALQRESLSYKVQDRKLKELGKRVTSNYN